MSETASISMGVASRYAKAIFDLILESNEVAKLETDVESLASALEDSQELRDLISSPMYTRDEQKGAIVAIGIKKNPFSQFNGAVLGLVLDVKFA